MKRNIFYLLATLFFLNVILSEAVAQQYTKRQFYSSGENGSQGKWVRDDEAMCYKIWWHFKVNPTDKKYHRQIAYCFDSQPDIVYFYNTVTKKYWGRCHLVKNHPEKSTYSELKPKDQKGRLSEIAECDFPSPGKMPRLKGPDENGQVVVSKDGVAMEPPPSPPI